MQLRTCRQALICSVSSWSHWPCSGTGCHHRTCAIRDQLQADPVSAGGRSRVEQWDLVSHSTTSPSCARAAALPFSRLGRRPTPKLIPCPVCLAESLAEKVLWRRGHMNLYQIWPMDISHAFQQRTPPQAKEPALCARRRGKQNNKWLYPLSEGAGLTFGKLWP